MLHKVASYAVFKLVTNSIWVRMLPSKAAVYVGSRPTVDNLQSKISKWELLHALSAHTRKSSSMMSVLLYYTYIMSW